MRSNRTHGAAAHVADTMPGGSEQVSEEVTEEVAALLGRVPRQPWGVAVRRRGDGGPVVIWNGPVLEGGMPMPTRFWLVGRAEVIALSRLEASGGVSEAERAVDAGELARAHDRYRRERDAAIPAGWAAPRPSGGVGGTRRGVKCLHAHLAWWLAGGEDPVGAWAASRCGIDAQDYAEAGMPDGATQATSCRAARTLA